MPNVSESIADGQQNVRKIGLVGPFPPYRGGIAQFSERLFRDLKRLGHDVTAVSFLRQYPSLLFPGTSQETSPTDQDPDASRLLDTLSPWSWGASARKLIDSEVEEVVFMYWMPFFAPALSRMATLLKRKGIRVSVIVHNAIPHERQPMAAWLTRHFLSKCDHIVALSEAVKRDIRSIGVDASVCVQPHPTYDQFGAPVDRVNARKKLGIEPEEKVALFFGLVRPYKGLDVLVKALPQSVTQPQLVVAGEWYDKQPALRREASQLTPPAIIEDGYITDSDVSMYFSAADVVVQPYRSATQSGVVQTAFHFGKPVIVTGVGGLPEMVRHDEDALVVAPSDERALASAIDLFFEPETQARLTEGASRAGERSTWEAFTDGILHPPSSSSTFD